MRHSGGRWRLAGVVLAVLAGSAGLAACQWITLTTTTLSASPAQVLAGQPVTFTATVSPSPPGSVDFADGATLLGTVALVGGSATLSTAALQPGSHQVTASYRGAPGFGASSSNAVSVTIQAPPTRYYVSLGDSLATGIGAPAGQGYVDDVLAHEQQRLPGLTATKLSCPGATTTSMIKGGGCTYPAGSQLAAAEAFLQAKPGQVAFITIDIGANDITGCFAGGNVNLTCAQAALATIQANLTQILAGLRSAGGAVPIFGMTYYDPFLAAWVTGGQTFAQQSQTLAQSGNAAIQSTYQSAGAATADVAAAFDSANFALTGTYQGTTVPQNVANICAWTLMCQSQNIHANATGHQVIANTFDPLIDAAVPAG